MHIRETRDIILNFSAFIGTINISLINKFITLAWGSYCRWVFNLINILWTIGIHNKIPICTLKGLGIFLHTIHRIKLVLFFNIWSTGIFVHVEIWSHSLEKFKPQQSYTSCKKTNDFRDESKIVFLVISNTKVVQFWTEFMYTCSLNIRWNKNYSFNVFSAV